MVEEGKKREEIKSVVGCFASLQCTHGWDGWASSGGKNKLFLEQFLCKKYQRKWDFLSLSYQPPALPHTLGPI